MNRVTRIDFLDVLRAFIILLVIVMHTALAYVAGYTDWVHNPQSNSLFGLIMVFVESGVWMPILFFIAGYFTLPSLFKRTPGEFLRGKLARLGIPLALGILILSPILKTLSYYSEGGSLPFFQALVRFIPPFFNGMYHFWFLSVLLLFFGGVSLLHARGSRLLSAAASAPGNPPAWLFAALVGATALGGFILNLFYHYGDWICLYILQYQAVKFPLYLAYFCLGIYAYRRAWFVGGYRPRLLPWSALYAVTFVLALGLFTANNGNPTTLLGKALLNLNESLETLAALMTTLALFQRLCARTGPALRSLSSLSFNAYVVHLNLVFLILYLTQNLDLPLLPKYALQAAAGVLASWGLAALLRLITSARRVKPAAGAILAKAG